MSDVFSGYELIHIAMDIERRGISFYDVMAKSSDAESARAAFYSLAGMEREHLVTFQNMLAEVHASGPGDRLTQEYPPYVQALINEFIFTDDMITSEIATQADTDLKAIELGISVEKDSIIFYGEMKENINQRAIPVIDRIIAEEKSHLQTLSEVKKKLAGRG